MEYHERIVKDKNFDINVKEPSDMDKM